MKKCLLLAVVLAAGMLAFAQVAMGQAYYYKGAVGYLRMYSSMLTCSGSNSLHAGHFMQYTTNGGTTWVDCGETDGNGYFQMTPNIGYVGPMKVRAKPQCNDEIYDHNDRPCGTSDEFDYKGDAAYFKDVGTLYSYRCPIAR